MSFSELNFEQQEEALRLARICVDGSSQTRIKTENTKKAMAFKIAGCCSYDLEIKNGKWKLWVE
jgi:hypothetical protein